MQKTRADWPRLLLVFANRYEVWRKHTSCCRYHLLTNVFVSDPTQGYGVFIDWMLDESDGMAE